MIIRNETSADIEAISQVTIAAFKHHPFSEHTEQCIIKALRDAGSLTISLVADVAGQIRGHIAFSPVTISDGSRNWYGLGPVAVLPEYQKQGIGKALVQQGLTLLKTMGCKGCALVGDPAYYERFGFKNIPGLTYEGVPLKFFLALPFDENHPQGTVTFHNGFSATE